jgi:hypothetical protein
LTIDVLFLGVRDSGEGGILLFIQISGDMMPKDLKKGLNSTEIDSCGQQPLRATMASQIEAEVLKFRNKPGSYLQVFTSPDFFIWKAY